MASIQSPTRPNSSWQAPELVTSVITSISSQRSTTGSTKTEYTTNNKPTSEELKFIHWVPSITLVCWTSPDCTPLGQLEEWTDGPDTIETPTWKSTSHHCLQPKSSRLSGTEPQSLSEDWPLKKSNKKTNTHIKPFSIRALKLC